MTDLVPKSLTPNQVFISEAITAARSLREKYDWREAVDLASRERDEAMRETNIIVVFMFVTISSIFLFLFFKIDVTLAIFSDGFFSVKSQPESLTRVYFAYIFIHLFFLARAAKFSRVIFAEIVLVELLDDSSQTRDDKGLEIFFSAFRLHPSSFFHLFSGTSRLSQFASRSSDFLVKYLLVGCFSLVATITLYRFFYQLLTLQVFDGVPQSVCAFLVLFLLHLSCALITLWFIFCTEKRVKEVKSIGQ